MGGPKRLVWLPPSGWPLDGESDESSFLPWWPLLFLCLVLLLLLWSCLCLLQLLLVLLPWLPFLCPCPLERDDCLPQKIFLFYKNLFVYQ